MRRPLLFATTNPGKLRELQALATGLDVLSAADVASLPTVEETEFTLQGNARRESAGLGEGLLAGDAG